MYCYICFLFFCVRTAGIVLLAIPMCSDPRPSLRLLLQLERARHRSVYSCQCQSVTLRLCLVQSYLYSTCRGLSSRLRAIYTDDFTTQLLLCAFSLVMHALYPLRIVLHIPYVAPL